MIKKKKYNSFTDEQKKEAYKVLESSNKDPFLKGYFDLSKFIHSFYLFEFHKLIL